MIRNLNQVSFQHFGTISPERGQLRPPVKGAVRRTLQLSEGDIPVYRGSEDCWLGSGSGMTVLSVSENGKEFLHYYLDKSVCVRAGIWFYLSPFQSGSTAELTASRMPELVGNRLRDSDLLLSSRLSIRNIYTFYYQEKEQGFLFSGEAHTMPELTYVDQGIIHSVADGQELILEQGDLVLYGPNQWHMQYADIGVAPRFVTIVFEVEGDDLSEILGKKIRASQRAVALLQQMLREQERMDAYSDDMILALLNQLILTLLRESNTRAPVEKLRTANAIHSENEIIRRAQQYISGHIREKLSVPLVARMVDVSPSYLTALFHKNLQISPGEYIRRAKLQESKQMIREDNLNFTEIAAALQYSTVHHFSRQFKEKFGITPTEYAKSVR